MGKNRVLIVVLNFINALIIAISIIAISTITTLNFKFIYRTIISKYDLVNTTGLSSDILMINYNKLIDYFQNPFNDTLELPNFFMSKYGKIHFYQVKKIFIFLIVIGIIFILFNTIYISMCKVKNKKNYKIIIMRNFNLAANILIIFFIILTFAYVIDFSKAFILFHKIFFRNNYWIFDASTDPIINALPEDLFMIYGAIILGIIIISSIIIKIINKKMLQKLSSSKNSNTRLLLKHFN